MASSQSGWGSVTLCPVRCPAQECPFFYYLKHLIIVVLLLFVKDFIVLLYLLLLYCYLLLAYVISSGHLPEAFLVSTYIGIYRNER